MAIRLEEELKAKSGKDYKDQQKRELAEYYNLAGVQHFELNQLEEALQHYDLAIEYDKGMGIYYYNRGLLWNKRNQLEQAIEDYGKVIELLEFDPDYTY